MSLASSQSMILIWPDRYELTLEWVRSSRKTLSIEIQQGQVKVRAPRRMSWREVATFLMSRRAWIETMLVQHPAAPLHAPWGEGIKLLHLGEELSLEIRSAASWRCFKAEDVVVIQGPGSAVELQERCLKAWRRAEAGRVFKERMAALHESLIQDDALLPSGMGLRSMRTRWGSCSTGGRITLNVELIRMPVELIDYVIVHELCHLREFHHGPAFYELLAGFMPDWAKRREALKRWAARVDVY
ncbi:MAG: M48 family metallopeptidase [Pseudomonadales bacterium]|nr:M48 family metallopeptidase [Pseudomonadales bacterium]